MIDDHYLEVDRQWRNDYDQKEKIKQEEDQQKRYQKRDFIQNQMKEKKDRKDQEKQILKIEGQKIVREVKDALFEEQLKE